MAIDGFCELFNIVYIAKKLHDMGKYDLVKSSFFDSLEHDVYYENMHSLIPNLFTYHYCQCYKGKYFELHVLSDPVIEDFYRFAGEYGKLHHISDSDNPYINEAKQQVSLQLNFSYCLDWMLMGHTEPKRPYHSRLGLFISYDGDVDLGCLAYALIEICEWFADSCEGLRSLLSSNLEAIAA